MEKKYVKPNMEILEADFDDVIMTSLVLPDDDHPGDNEVELGMQKGVLKWKRKTYMMFLK